MNHGLIAKGLAAGRVAAGAALLVAPRQVAGAWLGAAGERPEAQLLARAVGARDLAIGLGALSARRDWILAGALSDAIDATVTILAGDRIPRSGRVLIGTIAIGGAAAGAALAARSPDDTT